MLTGLITNWEGQCFQPIREGCSGSLVFVHEGGSKKIEWKMFSNDGLKLLKYQI